MLNTAKYLTYIFLFREKYISLQYKTLTNNLFYLPPIHYHITDCSIILRLYNTKIKGIKVSKSIVVNTKIPNNPTQDNMRKLNLLYLIILNNGNNNAIIAEL